MDPDHPLAALVRKAQQEKNGNIAITTKPEDEVAAPAQAPSAEYTTDRKYRAWKFAARDPFNCKINVTDPSLQIYFKSGI